MLKGLVKSVYIFQNCTDTFLHEVIMRMEQCHYSANEMISDHCNCINGIYIIKSGRVRLNLAEESDNSEILQLKQVSSLSGQWKYDEDIFGEWCLLPISISVEVFYLC